MDQQPEPAAMSIQLAPLPRLSPDQLNTLYLHCTLPARVPSSDTDDTPTSDVTLLQHMSAAIQSLHSQCPPNSTAAAALRRALAACEAWSRTLFDGTPDAELLHSTLQSLLPGDSLPIHLHEHNAAILVTRPLAQGTPWSVCAFGLAMPAAQVSQGRQHLIADFPATAIPVDSTELLLSRALCEKLVDLDRAVLDVAAPHSRKAGTNNKEIREVAHSWPITEWLTTLLASDSSDSSSSSSLQSADSAPLRKKLRDVVSYKSALKPWRRSPQWMAIKASVQIILQCECPNDGAVLYKALMLHQLSVLARGCAASSGSAASKSDALQSMAVKIARRMDKLQLRVGSVEPMQALVRTVLLQAKASIEQVNAVVAARWLTAQRSMSADVSLNVSTAEFEAATRHEGMRCTASIEAALTRKPAPVSSASDALPDSPSRINLTASILTSATSESSRGLALGDAEQWLSRHLESWNPSVVNADRKCERLFGLLEAYHTTALKHYSQPSDPLGHSRSVIARLQLLRAIDQECCAAHPLLLQYRSGVDLAVLDYLLLPLQSDMSEAASLRDYFRTRDRNGMRGQSIMESSAFAVDFAQQSADMIATRGAIHAWAAEQWEGKLRELSRERQTYQRFKDTASRLRSLSCQCTRWTCDRCNSIRSTESYAANMSVDAFEEPLPTGIADQLIVIFEIRMPQCLRLLREALQLFRTRMQADSRSSSNLNDWPWLQSSQLQRWFLYPAQSRERVRLVSSTKPFVVSHYRSKHPTEPDSDFHPDQGRSVVHDNGLDAMVQAKHWKHETEQCLAFNLDSTYSALQFALHSTSHTQNAVIASQSECSQALSLDEFVALGSLRAGHTLQWHQLLSLIAMRTPNFQSDDVARFVGEAIWQMGPSARAVKDGAWLTESHVSGADPAFALELLAHLEEWLQRIQASWLNGTSLYVIVIIAMRLHSLNAGNQASARIMCLIRRCRLTAMQWMGAVKNAIQLAARQDQHKLMDKLVRVACFAALTFACDRESLQSIFSIPTADESASSSSASPNAPPSTPLEQWLHAINTIRQFALMNDAAVAARDPFSSLLLRQAQHTAIRLETTLHKLVPTSNYSCLTRSVSRWQPRLIRCGSWSRCPAPASSWYTCTETNAAGVVTRLHVNVLDGSFLVALQPVGYLPDTVTAHPLFGRVFGALNVRVLPGASGFYAATERYHDCIYRFEMRGADLIVREEQSNGDVFELIPHSSFAGDLPELLMARCSHWLDLGRRCVDFRRTSLLRNGIADGSFVRNISWRLDWESREVFEMRCDADKPSELTGRKLISIRSGAFDRLRPTMERLDRAEFVHVLIASTQSEECGAMPSAMDDVSSAVPEVIIELPRSGLTFTVDCANQLFRSRDHRGMIVAKEQDAGTLYGLKHALLLCSDDGAVESKSRLPPKQLLLVPHGMIALAAGVEHQSVSVQLPTSPSALVHVVSLKLNPILRRVEADSFGAWLYLALLHAATSHVHDDPFTGLTGTEQAMELLQSPRCLSSRPLSVDDRSQLLQGDHSVLMQIASLSPLCEFYPPHVKCMQTITDSPQLPSQACAPALYFATRHVHSESRRILFAESSESVEALPRFEIKRMEPQLLANLYFKGKQSHNTKAQLSSGVEQSLPGSAVQPFQAMSGPTDRFMLARQLLMQHTPVSIANPAGAADLLCSSSSLTVTPSEAVCFATDFADLQQFRSAWPNLMRLAVAARQNAESSLRFRLLLASLASFPRNSIDAAHLWLLLNVSLRATAVPASVQTLLSGADRLDETFESHMHLALLACVAQATMTDEETKAIVGPKLQSESEYEFTMRCRQIKSEEGKPVGDLCLDLARAHFASRSSDPINLSSVSSRFINVPSLRSDVDAHLRVWRFNRQLREELTQLAQDDMQGAEPAVERQVALQLFRSRSSAAAPVPLLPRLVFESVSQWATDESHQLWTQRDPFRLAGVTTSVSSAVKIETATLPSNPLRLAGLAPSVPNAVKVETTPLSSNAQAQQLMQSFADEEDRCAVGEWFQQQLTQSFEALGETRASAAVKLEFAAPTDPPALLQHSQRLHTDAKNRADRLWAELVCALSPAAEDIAGQALELVGLWPRLLPCSLLPHLGQTEEISSPVAAALTARLGPLRTVLGAVCVARCQQQQIARCIRLLLADQTEAALADAAHVGCANWIPCDRPEWLLFELEQDLTIREVQVTVATQMIDAQSSSLLQLNMGSGKSAVIVPMLCATLADGKQLARMTVLRSLFPTNFAALVQKLGGLLQRRVFETPCSRDMELKTGDVSSLKQLLEQCMAERGVVLTTPEYRLSFELLTFDYCRKENDALAANMLAVRDFFAAHARDVLDESDSILDVKYQLVYTAGLQQQLDGRHQRWRTVTAVLRLAQRRLPELHGQHPTQLVIEEASKDPSAFRAFRILASDSDARGRDGDAESSSSAQAAPSRKPAATNAAYQSLTAFIVEDLFAGLAADLRMPDRRDSLVREQLRAFLLHQDCPAEITRAVQERYKDHPLEWELVLILRGLLGCEVLLAGLSKRWRVQYGVSTDGERLMAVPFRAKDCAAERTEFGHCDVAILLTYLSYYQSGLSEKQVMETIEKLRRLSNRDQIYDGWIAERGQFGPEFDGIRSLIGINVLDSKQRALVHRLLSRHMSVIDFWLEQCVFPHEAKAFPHRMSSSAWDLSRPSTHATVGFSGTNDTQLLLPLHIRQCDLPSLQSTNALVIRHLLRPENERCDVLSAESDGEDILQYLIQTDCRVLIDCGALMLKLKGQRVSNKQVAVAWLVLCPPTIDAAVYFDARDRRQIIDRKGRVSPFDTSPLHLSRAVFYLDDAHTRGTDFVFPAGFRSCVTLGAHLTKEKLVQACMRMRKLGAGHSQNLLASHDVGAAIVKLRRRSDVCVSLSSLSLSSESASCAPSPRPSFTPASFGVVDVLRWTLANSVATVRDGHIHLANQGLSFSRKEFALALFRAGSKSYSQLGERCAEPESLKLTELFGGIRVPQYVHEIVSNRAHMLRAHLEQTLDGPAEIALGAAALTSLHNRADSLIERCRAHVGGPENVPRYAQVLDDEAERELEREEEEEAQRPRPPRTIPLAPQLEAYVLEMVRSGRLHEHPSLMPIAHLCEQTTLSSKMQPDAWSSQQLWVTRDFLSVVQHTKADLLDSYLNPMQWMLRLPHGADDQEAWVCVSSFEANEIMPRIRAGGCEASLHLFAPRLWPNQSTLIDRASASVPHVSQQSVRPGTALHAQLSVLAGGLYFTSSSEQAAFSNFLGCAPGPHQPSDFQSVAHAELIDHDGFVQPTHRAQVLPLLQDTCRFGRSPLDLVSCIWTARHRDGLSLASHAGGIVLRATQTNLAQLQPHPQPQ